MKSANTHRNCALCALIFLIPLKPALGGAIWFVDANAGPTNTGANWCSAFLDLQSALSTAMEGDEIRVADGTYKPDGGSQLRDSTFRLKRGVAVFGGFAGCGASNPDLRDMVLHETILSGDLMGNDAPVFANRADNCFHVVTNDDPLATGTMILDGFTIRGGHANGTLADKTDQGSGLHNFNGINPFTGKPVVRNCLFVNNWASNHGAFNDHGGATLINCEFRTNYAGMWGGGLYVHEGLITTVTNCRFISNSTDGTSGGGGGVVNEGFITLTNCLFDSNTSATRGGGMYNHSGALPTLVDCTFTGNTASNQGGAMYNTNCTYVSLSRCAYTGNIATNQGGGIYSNDNPDTSLSECTFTGNMANGISQNPDVIGTGGALYYWRTNGTITDCDFVGNSATKYAGAMFSGVESHPIVRRCLFEGNTAGARSGAWDLGINSDPVIVDTIFRGNSSDIIAGAFSNGSQNYPLLVNCTFEGNQSDQGGGAAYEVAASSTYVNCLFTGNASNPGGGMLIRYGSFTALVNCTFYGNSASQGAAIALDSFQQMTPSNISIANSILWNGPSSLWNNDNSTANIRHTCIYGGWPGAGNTDTDPMFVAPDNGDFQLQTGSPCLDSADSAELPSDHSDLDLDGDLLEQTPLDLSQLPRVSGDAPDMGAYETQIETSAPAASPMGLLITAAVMFYFGTRRIRRISR